jgi:hypothetical protein
MISSCDIVIPSETTEGSEHVGRNLLFAHGFDYRMTRCHAI